MNGGALVQLSGVRMGAAGRLGFTVGRSEAVMIKLPSCRCIQSNRSEEEKPRAHASTRFDVNAPPGASAGINTCAWQLKIYPLHY